MLCGKPRLWSQPELAYQVRRTRLRPAVSLFLRRSSDHNPFVISNLEQCPLVLSPIEHARPTSYYARSELRLRGGPSPHLRRAPLATSDSGNRQLPQSQSQRTHHAAFPSPSDTLLAGTVGRRSLRR